MKIVRIPSVSLPGSSPYKATDCGGERVSGNITTTHSTHNALHTAHTLHYTAIATIPLIHHSLHSLQPTPVTAANTRHYREILQDFKPYPGTGDRLPLGTMGKEEEEEEQ